MVSRTQVNNMEQKWISRTLVNSKHEADQNNGEQAVEHIEKKQRHPIEVTNEDTEVDTT